MGDVFTIATTCLSAMSELTPPQRRRLVSVLTAAIDLGDDHAPAPIVGDVQLSKQSLGVGVVNLHPEKETPRIAAPKGANVARGDVKRETILACIERHQDGATPVLVASETGLPRDTVAWHMRDMSLSGVLRREPNGNRTRYFRVSGREPQSPSNPRGQDILEMEARILQELDEGPLSPRVIASQLNLDRESYVFRRALKAVRESGHVTIVGDGFHRSYRLTEPSA